MSNNSFKAALAAAKRGDATPVMDFVRREPDVAAMVSKLNAAPHQRRGATREETLPDINRMRNLSDRTANNITDDETVMQILPDMDLAKEILVSAIIAPKDMMSTELNYSSGEGLMAPDVAMAMVKEIKEHFELVYNIKSKLGEMLRDMIFRTGSVFLAVIPENSIDEMINGSGSLSMESLKDTINHDGSIRNIGLLGGSVKETPSAMSMKPGLSLEAFDDFAAERDVDGRMLLAQEGQSEGVDTMITVLDNPDVLKIPTLHRKIREARISKMLGAGSAMQRATGSKRLGMENHRMSDREMAAAIFKNPTYGYKPVARVKTQDQLNRLAVGNPLVIHIASEAVMPVHVPGNPQEQIGFFVVLDGEGNPISRATSVDHFRQMSNRFNNNDNFASTLIRKVNSQMQGSTFDPTNQQHLELGNRIFGELVEQELIARLRNGRIYSNGATIARQEEVYRIMLARALAKQHTQLLFIPAELGTYFAFRYTDEGIGKTVLQDMKILSGLRVTALFANMAAQMKNSIGRTPVVLTMDPEDPDPQKSYEIAIHEFMKTRLGHLPVGMSNPADITQWMAQAGFEFTTEGHEGMPQMKIEVGEKASSYVQVDTEYEEQLRKRHIMGFGVSPESVDNAFGPEFATVSTQNNLMLSKRAMRYQEQAEPLLAEHHRKVIRNSEGLLKKLTEIIETNFDKMKDEWLKDTDGKALDFSGEEGVQLKREIIAEILEQFIRGLEVKLPRPNVTSLENQMMALKAYDEGLDVALEAFINSNFLSSDIVGDVSSQVDAWKEMVKGHFLRAYMAENGIFPELSQLTTRDEHGKPSMDLAELQKDHAEGIMATLGGFMRGMTPMKEATNAVLQDTGSTGGDNGSSDNEPENPDQQSDNGEFPDLNLDDVNNLDQQPDNTAPVEGEDDAPAQDDPEQKKDDDDADNKDDDENKDDKPE